MNSIKNIEVVYSPALLPFYQLNNKIVVVIDILRATTSICVAFNTGVNKILPVASPEECALFKDFDFLCAAERNAEKIPGFDMGNSPFEFQNPLLKDRNIAFTTTNGTKAIKMCKELGAEKIVIGSFLNLAYLSNWLKNQHLDVVLLCAGWKNKVNLEDTLFAGAVVDMLEGHLIATCDSGLMAQQLFKTNAHQLILLVRKSSHAQRFKLLNHHTDDVAFCLQLNTTPVLPILSGEYIINHIQ